MSQLEEAVSRYNRLLESGPYRDLSWVEALQQRMESSGLSAGGRLVCPFLRPNFISRRQYDSLVKTGESLIGAIDRVQQMVLTNPALLSRLELLPAENGGVALAGPRDLPFDLPFALADPSGLPAGRPAADLRGAAPALRGTAPALRQDIGF